MNEIIDRDLLIAVPLKQDALHVFTTEGAIDPLLKMVRDKIDAFNGDATTASGRKAIKSMAHKVSQSKVALEEVGKQLADEQKEIPKKIDATRKRIKETLDKWRDEVRAPADEWDAKEEARVDRIKSSLSELQNLIADQAERPALILRERLVEVETDYSSFEHFDEYAEAAAELKTSAVAALNERIAAADKREAERAELEKLRAEAAERARKDNEDRLRKEGEQRAREEAEADARVEADRAARALADEKAAAEKRERDLIQAKEDAERRAIAAAAKAKQELIDKQAAIDAETEKREANKKHRAKINREAMAALVASGIADDIAKQVVTLIASKAVPNITIHY